MDIEVLKTLTFGFPQSQWDAAKLEAREQLIVVAKRAGTIAYGDLAAKIKSISFGANDDPFHKMLGQISVAEEAARRGMLSVLVVHRGGDMRPGPGLFELAQQLGRDTKDREKFWIDEFNVVLKAWSKSA
jgi:hypothetical protein